MPGFKTKQAEILLVYWVFALFSRFYPQRLVQSYVPQVLIKFGVLNCSQLTNRGVHLNDRVGSCLRFRPGGSLF